MGNTISPNKFFLLRHCRYNLLPTIDMSFVLRHLLICGLMSFPLFPAVPAGAAQTCVESIIPTTPDASFTIAPDGTTIDNSTGLMWMRCSLGQEWNGNTCSGSAAAVSWADALKAAENQEFAGYTDWRLPNKNELESIVEGRCSLPATNSKIFPATPSTYFWSSSPYAPVSPGAWSVDFAYGTVNATVKTFPLQIRLVRDPEW